MLPRYFAYTRHFAISYSMPPRYFAYTRHFAMSYSMPSRYFAYSRHIVANNPVLSCYHRPTTKKRTPQAVRF